MTSSGADRFRNYSDVLYRHEREMRIKKIIRVFIMFMVILVLIALIFFLWRVEQGDVPFEKLKKSSYEKSFPERSEGEPPGWQSGAASMKTFSTLPSRGFPRLGQGNDFS
jgi:hypothetical protein